MITTNAKQIEKIEFQRNKMTKEIFNNSSYANTVK